MLLCADIGNTNYKLGLFQENNLVSTLRTTSEEEIAKYIAFSNITKACISSVNPKNSDKLNYFLNTIVDISPILLTCKSKFGFSIKYDTPQTLGIDRLCGLAGAKKLIDDYQIEHNHNRDSDISNDIVMTVDCGTATTINILTPLDGFIGGLILPGLTTMYKSLNRNTAQLPEINLNDEFEQIGKSTKESILAGIFQSTKSVIESTIIHLENEFKSPVMVFLTGGDAAYLKRILSPDYRFEQNLNLIGICKLFELNSL